MNARLRTGTLVAGILFAGARLAGCGGGSSAHVTDAVAFSAAPPVTASAVPTYAAANAVLPGIVWTTTPLNVGTPQVIDFGTPANAATSYDVAMYRDGVLIGSASSAVTSYSYVPVTADSGHVLSPTVAPRNSLGAGPLVRIPGLVVK